MTHTDALTSGAGRAAAYTEILNLEARYAMTWDCADAAGWAAVFTPDGQFQIAAVGERQPLLLEGHRALEAFCADFTRDWVGVHLPSLPYVEFDGDTARGHLNFHFVAIGRHSGSHTSSRTATGHYEVVYQRTPGGWRMQHRLERPTASARSEFFDY